MAGFKVKVKVLEGCSRFYMRRRILLCRISCPLLWLLLFFKIVLDGGRHHKIFLSNRSRGRNQ